MILDEARARIRGLRVFRQTLPGTFVNVGVMVEASGSGGVRGARIVVYHSNTSNTSNCPRPQNLNVLRA